MKKYSGKFLAALLSLLIIFSFTACGGSGASGNESSAGAELKMGDNEIAELFDQGFECRASQCDEKSWKGLFYKEDSFDEIYFAKADMTPELYEEYFEMHDAENAAEQQDAFITTLEKVVVKDVSYIVPTQETLDQYVGKKIGDLEAEGFENTGYVGGDEDGTGWTFSYSGPEFEVDVALEDGFVIEDIDDYSPNDIRELTIGGVTFTGISSTIMDNEF